MKTMKTLLITLAAFMMLPDVVMGAKKWEKIKTPPLRDVQVPEVQRQSLDNGIELFVLEDHELPLFRATLIMKGGDAYNPPDKLGLAGITATVLRMGGSTVISGDELDELLEGSGASVEVFTDDKTTTISINVLIEDARKSLEIVRDLLMKPAYPQEKIDLALTQSRSAISRRNDDASAIADREFNKLLYGVDHPFAQQIEYEHLDNITRDDLVAFHKKYYHPTNAYLALWGDFDNSEITEMTREILGVWPNVAVDYPSIPDVPEVSRSINLVVKESVNQSNIRLGHRSVTRKHPDYYALVVMNELLGGGLGSRLFNEVRSAKGLAYRVGSGLGANLAEPGMFRVVCGTKSETTIQAMRACLSEVERMKNEPVTDEELKRAKDGLLNSHVFNFANKGAIVRRQMRYERNGYPANFVEQFTAEINKVTKEDIQKAASSFLKPENFAMLVVGKPDDFDEPLSSFGEVNEIDITIPEPKGAEFPEPTPETLARGKEVVAKAAKAVGGSTKLAGVENQKSELDVTVSMMGQTIPAKATRYLKYPANMRMEINIMGQLMVQVYNGDEEAGYMQMPQGKKEFDTTELKDSKDAMSLEIVNFLGNYADYQPQYLEDGEVEGEKVQVVIMTPPHGGKKFKLSISTKSSLPLKIEHPGKNFQGAPVNQEVFWSDYREVAGIKLPHASKILQDGDVFMELNVKSLSLTDAIPEELFAQGE